MSIWDTASAAIDAAFAVSVTYAGSGIALNDPISAIREDMPGEPFMGPGATVTMIGFEIKRVSLPRRPEKGDTIDDGRQLWRVQDVTDRDPVDAWFAIVEQAR
ncbi:head-tail joining protein [Sphingomonas sp. SRS2]|uniref:head-tail joining protein n=1 Tax=Sphingomonas sp. SRS2 TaxID=133190 RepID=UPI0006184505|nr:hypothetical protein [Sphingomonas sp. SRS2]KKC24856.1 hypothetical protein WP12_16600 [Sphingomonas sp. SRS2]